MSTAKYRVVDEYGLQLDTIKDEWRALKSLRAVFKCGRYTWEFTAETQPSGRRFYCIAKLTLLTAVTTECKAFVDFYVNGSQSGYCDQGTEKARSTTSFRYKSSTAGHFNDASSIGAVGVKLRIVERV
ncbi:hypothetical protein AAVH_24778, partial [Aphelenchoides avenae]